MTEHLSVGEGDEDLERRLETGLDEFNAAATRGVAEQQKLTVRIDDAGDLVAGASGWTWGAAAGISMTWVREDRRGVRLGERALEAFESEARRRGCTHVFVTSFTFQAPGFYQRLGYTEFARWEAVPAVGSDDIHLRKQL